MFFNGFLTKLFPFVCEGGGSSVYVSHSQLWFCSHQNHSKTKCLLLLTLFWPHMSHLWSPATLRFQQTPALNLFTLFSYTFLDWNLSDLHIHTFSWCMCVLCCVVRNWIQDFTHIRQTFITILHFSPEVLLKIREGLEFSGEKPQKGTVNVFSLSYLGYILM